MKKRLSILFVSVMMIMCMPFTVFASNVSDHYEESIEHLLNQRAELLCREQDDGVRAVDQKLAASGVIQLTAKAAGNISWFSYTTEYCNAGEAYIIRTLTAQPKSSDSCLALSGDRMVKASHEWLNSSMHASAEDGAIQIAGGEIAYSYAHVTTVSFQYVKRKNEPDSQLSLAYVSSKGTTAVGYQFPTFRYLGGSVKPDVIQGNYMIDSTPKGYSSAYQAVKAYIDPYAAKTAFIASVQLTGNENENVSYIYPVFPQTPAQLF